MRTLQISQLKPNPAGKDRNRTGTVSATQLAGEWVDIKNTGNQSANLENVELNHKAFSPQDPAGRWVGIFTFPNFILRAGEVVRIHSGRNRDLSVIAPADMSGANYHGFTGMDNYVWNNREGDTAALWNLTHSDWIEQSSYDPYPPEGVVLVRVGSKLVSLVPSFINLFR